MPLNPAAPLRTLKHDLQAPTLAITHKTSPPALTLHLQLNGFFSHELVLKALVLPNELRKQGHQALPLLFGELKCPALSADQNGKVRTSEIQGQAPTWPFLLDHPGSRSGWSCSSLSSTMAR